MSPAVLVSNVIVGDAAAYARIQASGMFFENTVVPCAIVDVLAIDNR